MPVAPAKLEIHLYITLSIMNGYELNIGTGRGQTPNYICSTQQRGLVTGQAVCCSVLMTLFKAVRSHMRSALHSRQLKSITINCVKVEKKAQLG